MTSPPEPITEIAPDAPRLPDAAPAEVTAAAPPDAALRADQPAVESDESTKPEKSGTPVGFFVLMLLIVGAIVAIGAVVRPWENTSEDPATIVIDEPTETTSAATTDSTTPATTSPATTTPATTVQTATAATATDPTTTLVVGALPEATPTPTIGPIDDDALFAELERCRLEQRTVFVSLQAFVNETGAHPSDPDSLANNGWLEPHPDGWSTRWAFDYSMSGIAVVPVAGGGCDL